MKHIFILLTFVIVIISCKSQKRVITDTIFCTHKVVLDEQNKIIPWYSPAENAYDHFLHLRWDFIKNKVPNSPGPDPGQDIPSIISIVHSRFSNDSILPDTWMNDIGKKSQTGLKTPGYIMPIPVMQV